MSETPWVKVFETPMLHQAVMVQSILREHNIEAVILNQQDSSYVIVGEINVYVQGANAAEAMTIVEKVMEE
jgi:hypothetical protein